MPFSHWTHVTFKQIPRGEARRADRALRRLAGPGWWRLVPGPARGARLPLADGPPQRIAWENSTISSIDSGCSSIGHGAKTDSDPARPPGGDHLATQQASPGVLTRSAARRAASDRRRRVRTRAPKTRRGRAAARGCGFPDDSGIEEERAGGGPDPAGGGPYPAGGGPERAWIRADDVYPSTCGALTDRMMAETLRVQATASEQHCSSQTEA